MQRKIGTLLPIASLPSACGIGTLGKPAFDFIDFLSNSCQEYWQVLPLVPTGYGDSPYQSCCGYAGSEYYIDLDRLVKTGLLTKDDLPHTERSSRIDYGWLYETRITLLKKAFSAFSRSADFDAFLKNGEYYDYAVFRALKETHGGSPWNLWEDKYKFRAKNDIDEFCEKHRFDIEFWQWAQFEFQAEWDILRAYAKEKGIKIIGDIPIYVAYDSVECWTNPSIFKFDGKYMPTVVAGCPPDFFSKTGQLWGNPIYDWEKMAQDGYAWWKGRLSKSLRIFDVVRIDHFRGFDKYYEIPYGAKTAENGKWQKGPSREFFETLKGQLGDIPLIAEDLGDLDNSARNMLKDVGFPGMKVLSFAFDSDCENDYLPHNYATSNCVVYTGTHDNDTLLGLLEKHPDRERFMELLNDETKLYGIPYVATDDEARKAIVALALCSTAQLVVVPLQDWLGIGSEGRINAPSTLSANNWSYRVPYDYASISEKIVEIIEKYGKIKENNCV